MVNQFLDRGDCRLVGFTLICLGNHVPNLGLPSLSWSLKRISLLPVSYWALIRNRLLGCTKVLHILRNVKVCESLLHGCWLIKMVDVISLRLQELSKSIPVLSFGHKFENFKEVARIPGWSKAPNLVQELVIFIDCARKKRSHLKIQKILGIVDVSGCLIK